MINPDIATKFAPKSLFCFCINLNLKDLLEQNQQKQSRQEEGKVNRQMLPLPKKTRHNVASISFQHHHLKTELEKENTKSFTMLTAKARMSST